MVVVKSKAIVVPRSALTSLHAPSGGYMLAVTLKLTLNIPTTSVQPLPHGGYQSYNQPYNQPYNPAAVAYNNDQGGEDEEEEEGEEEQDPYYRGYPPQYYPQQPSRPTHYGHRSGPAHSEDTELRSPGVARRFPREVAVEEREEGGL